MSINANKKKLVKSQYPIPVRIFHSINVAAVLLMASTGMQIYNATPVFGGKSGVLIPKIFVLGGWLAGGRHLHFAIMWIFFLNFATYVAYIVATKRWKTRLANKADAQILVQKDAADKRKTYAFHRFIYTASLPMLLLSLLSGIAMYKPVQFDFISTLAGSWQNLRVIHFISVPFLAFFIILHSWLGFKVGGWRLIRSIWRVT